MNNPPTEAQSQTPLTEPARVLISAISLLEHNGAVAMSIGAQLRDAVATLETALAAAKERAKALEAEGEHQRLVKESVIADRDALAEKLRRCEGELGEAQSVIMATRQMSIEGMDAIRAAAGAPPSREDKSKKRAVDYVAELSSRLAALQQQVGEADKLAEAGAVVMAEWDKRDGHLVSHFSNTRPKLEMLRSALASYRLARQPDQKTTLSPSV